MIVDMEKEVIGRMRTALEQACERFPSRLWQHEPRRFVARKILASATGGKSSSGELTEAAMKAALTLYAAEMVNTGQSRPSSARKKQ
jgi:hypothetical protein